MCGTGSIHQPGIISLAPRLQLHPYNLQLLLKEMGPWAGFEFTLGQGQFSCAPENR